jgi:hypothetical protein
VPLHHPADVAGAVGTQCYTPFARYLRIAPRNLSTSSIVL